MPRGRRRVVRSGCAGGGSRAAKRSSARQARGRCGFTVGRPHGPLPPCLGNDRRNRTTGDSPSTCAGHPPRPPLRSWSVSPASAGASRNASRPPRARSDSTRSGTGPHGTGTSPSPCSPWPSWPPSPPTRHRSGPPIRTAQPAAVNRLSSTVPEIRHLLTAVFGPPAVTAARLQWSTWRRRHQATARHSHYRRRSVGKRAG